jgi:hypothetical protein
MPQKFPIIFKEEQPVISRENKIFQGLGIDYGLIFEYDCGNQIGFTLDGTKIENLEPSISNHDLFFDKEQKKLYYTQSTCLYEWPNKLIKDFGTPAWGIAKYKKEMIVALKDSNQIVNIEGKILFDGLNTPYNLREFQGKLYHTEGTSKGLVETPDKQIKTTGTWANGLGVSPDGKRLYFGGCDQMLYSYDGKEVKTICNSRYLWSICAVKEKNEVIYCAGSDYGIDQITLSGDKVLESRKILEHTRPIYSIVHAPIDFIKKLEEVK